MFSELVQPFCGQIISFDIDHFAIEKFYTGVKEKGYKNILPLLLDLSNPRAAIGWSNSERKSFVERGKADLILALALIHHLSIGNNVPLIEVAKLMSELTEWLIIEFVSKEDKQVQRLLVTREDIFWYYTGRFLKKLFKTFLLLKTHNRLPELKECFI